jgi:hypothetical protein
MRKSLNDLSNGVCTQISHQPNFYYCFEAIKVSLYFIFKSINQFQNERNSKLRSMKQKTKELVTKVVGL